MTDRMETREAVARAICVSDGHIFDEVCGYEAGDSECDSGTCVAANYEDHDYEWARDVYRRQADAAIAAMPDHAEMVARVARTMTDHGRMLWQDDVTGICASPDMCFGDGGRGRCSPCANKQAEACGVPSDWSPSYSPEVCRLTRELTALRAVAGQMAATLERVRDDIIAFDANPVGVIMTWRDTARAALTAYERKD